MHLSHNQNVFLLRLPNSAVINCHFSILSQSLCSVHSTAAGIYKAQTRRRSCSRWRLVYTATVARWQLMTHKSGQVKLPPPCTKCSTTRSTDYQRNDRNMQEMHLQTFSNMHSLKKRKIFTAPGSPAEREGGKLDHPVGTELCQWLKWGKLPETFYICMLLIVCTKIVNAQMLTTAKRSWKHECANSNKPRICEWAQRKTCTLCLFVKERGCFKFSVIWGRVSSMCLPALRKRKTSLQWCGCCGVTALLLGAELTFFQSFICFGYFTDLWAGSERKKGRRSGEVTTVTTCKYL